MGPRGSTARSKPAVQPACARHATSAGHPPGARGAAAAGAAAPPALGSESCRMRVSPNSDSFGMTPSGRVRSPLSSTLSSCRFERETRGGAKGC